MKHEIIFRTSPMLTEFLFRKVCDQIEDDIPDIDMDRVQASDPDTTMVDLVLAYFLITNTRPLHKFLDGTMKTNVRNMRTN